MYNELNNLRIETTINDPTVFRGLRSKRAQSDDAVPQLLPLRKSVADTTLRARVSHGINERFADHLATTRSTTPFGQILADVTHRLRRRGRTVRALDPTGKDHELLRAIADPRFAVGGLSNKDLRRLLANTDRYAGKTRKQRSGMTTRSLRLLREHGVIRKLPNAYRYHLTAKGRRLVTVLQAALAASTEELTKLAA